MKTKNIFKTVAFAMLMPTMLLTTACSSEDDLVNNTAENTETVANKGYALPVTVSATRQGDGTRATFDGSKLNFSEGDKLFVSGSATGAGSFAGTLDYDAVSGKFSGTIYTQNLYEGTIDDLLNGNYATLLPAGYESYDYLEIMDEGYEALLGESANNSFATSKKLAVEQLSFETGEYTSGTGFTLNPCNAILNFTITGLTPSTKVTASLSDGSPLFNIEGDVTTDGSGNATFAMGVFGTRDLNELSLTVAGNPVTLVNSSTELEAGKIYNITRSAVPASTPLDNTTTAWTAGTYAVPAGGKTYSDAITVSGDVTLVLTDGATLTLNKGISLASGATLTIEGNGTMAVNGTNNSTASTVAGSGTIILTSGTLTAKGGNGAGISGWVHDQTKSAGGVAINGAVTVSGGTLTATGGNGGSIDSNGTFNNAGVGGAAISGSVTVNGGTVTATGGNGGNLKVTISGGVDDARAGNGGAAIGGDATITSGTWTATNGSNGTYNVTSGCYGCSAGTGGKAVAGTVTDNR